MKHLLLIFTLILANLALNAQGISFFEKDWETALAEAKKQDKIIFVDAYAVWCGPCKRMAREVFTRKDVGDFYNANFVSIKLDMEKTPGIRFMQTYPVRAFPTFYFIDWNGEVVMTTRGAKPADQFIALTITGSFSKKLAIEISLQTNNHKRFKLKS